MMFSGKAAMTSWLLISPLGVTVWVSVARFWKGDLKVIFLLHWRFLPIFNRLRVIRPSHFGWYFPTAGEVRGVFGENDPKKWKYRKTLARRALPHVKPRVLSNRAWKSVHGYELYAWLGKKESKKILKGTRSQYFTTMWGRHRWYDLNQVRQSCWSMLY